MSNELIPIDDAAQAVPCDVETLRKWLQQGHITGRDSFGRTDRHITNDSTGIVVSVDSLKIYCASIGITPRFTRKR